MLLDKSFWQELEQDLPGWISEKEAQFLVEHVIGNSYVEIGVAHGKSFRIIKHHFPDISMKGYELLACKWPEEIADDVVVGDASKYVETHEDDSIDTLFIDGRHTYNGCMEDTVLWYNKVKRGGYIIFHDYGRNGPKHIGVKQAVNAVKDALFQSFENTNFIACGKK